MGDCNEDHSAVRWAAERLLDRKEPRKILMVLSDGQPAAEGMQEVLAYNLKEEVKRLDKMGVECVGMGIKSTAVRHYYKDNVVINNISELPIQAMKKMSQLLTKV